MSHIYHQLYYHTVWSTKNKNPVITNDVEEKLKSLINNKIKQLDSKLLEFNTSIDHCHLLSQIPPKISVSDFMGKLKGFTSHEVNKIKGEKYLKWQQGFGALSLSEKGIPFVKKYIQNQKQHHEDNTIIDILEYTPQD